MRFPMPNFPCDFELPDEWLAEGGLIGFVPPGAAYRSSSAAIEVPLELIEPPHRKISVPMDWRGFDRKRLIRIFKGFVAGEEIEAVPLFELPDPGYPRRPYRFRVLNGVHRFYASIAAGFESLPGDISWG